MKLYFYFLEESSNVDQRTYIRLEECEVAEKQKTYKLVDGPTASYGYCFVKKKDIGKISGIFKNVVVLLENDNAAAAKIFKERCEKLILAAEETIKDAKKLIARQKQVIEFTEEWGK